MYSQNREYDKAIVEYTQALRLDPNYTLAYNDRSYIYGEIKKDYDRAIADYTQAIRLNPNFVAAYHNRGSVYGHKRDYTRVIADFETALRLDPSLTTTRNSLQAARQMQRVAQSRAPCDSGADCSAYYIRQWVQVTPWNGYRQGFWVPCNPVGCTHCGTR